MPVGDMLYLEQEHLDELELTYEEALAQIEPTVFGPTWQTDEDGDWLLPRYTLGWQIAEWCAKWLKHPDGEGPWVFTMEQLRFILWWYAVDKTGRFTYRDGVLQRLKGWGKDPLLAVICLVEMLGPSRLSHWDEAGQPVGKRHPRAWVSINAVSQPQTFNTVQMIYAIVGDDLKAATGFDPGVEILRAYSGKVRIEASTSSYRALEGKRFTFVVGNETHHWVTGNHGHKMMETIRGNLTKMGSRLLCITNAYLPGEDSVAQRMREAYEKVVEGRAVDARTLYDTIEANPKTPLAGPLFREALLRIRGDAIWLDPVEIEAEVSNSSVEPARSRRMWLNQVVAESDSLHGPETWDHLGDEDAILEPGDEVTLGFDGGKTDDSTALVAIRVRDHRAFLLHLQEKPDGPESDGWEVNRRKVDSAVREAFNTYTVRAFFADVNLWESYIADWSEDYGEQLDVKASGRGPIGWDMRQGIEQLTRMHESLLDAIFNDKFAHDGDRRLRRHVLNAKRYDNKYGVMFGKESRESPRKVDAYAAMMLAHGACEQLRLKPAKKQERTGRTWFM